MTQSVHSQQRALEQIFSGAAAAEFCLDTDAGACLLPLLNALGWRGEPRHVIECLPHFGEIRDLVDLRAVLARLNFETVPSSQAVARLGAEQLPCLLATDDGAISVILERSNGGFAVFDGRERCSRNVDAKDLAGRVYPIRPVDVERLRQEALKHGWMQLMMQRFRGLFVQLLGVTFVSNLFALAVPIYVMTVYDRVIGTRSTDTLAYFFAGIALVIAADAVLRLIRARALAYLGARVDSLLGGAALQQLLHLPVTMVERAAIGTQITRLKQFESIREVFTGQMAAAFLDLPFVVVFVLAIVVIGGPLALVPVGLIVVFAVMAAVTIPLTRLHVKNTGEARARMQNFLIETVAKQRAIKEAAAEEIWFRRYAKLASEAGRTLFRSQQTTQAIQTIAQSLVMAAGVATLGIGALLVMHQTMTVGALIAVMALVWRVLSPIQSIFLSLNRVGQVVQSFKQVNLLMRLKLERVPGQVPSSYRAFQGTVQLARVGFRYGPRVEPALMGVSLHIPAGQFVAVTGPSGSGASTLLKVVAGLYEPQAGAVHIDGLDIRQLDSGELRDSIGYVPQDPVFFYGTVEQNLRLVNPTASRAQIEQAARDAALDDYRETLVEGLETRLNSEFQRRMADGLKQRLSLARAFVKNAPIYLLDEPANGLDRGGDRALMRKLEALRGKATIIMVTHRPSHMRLADRLIYMEDGQIVHDAKPEQVLPLIHPHSRAPAASAESLANA